MDCSKKECKPECVDNATGKCKTECTDPATGQCKPECCQKKDNYYKKLDVDPKASEKEIEKNYQKKAYDVHPVSLPVASSQSS